MNIFACTENLDSYDFNTAFRIAHDQIGGPNGIFWYRGEPFTTLLDTEKEELINEGLLDAYNEAIQKTLVEFPNGLALEAGLTQIEVVLSDPPNIVDLKINENEIANIPYQGEEIGGIWEALQELGNVVVEAFTGE